MHPTRVFLCKSAEAVEGKRDEILQGAEKCRKLQRNAARLERMREAARRVVLRRHPHPVFLAKSVEIVEGAGVAADLYF